jgi:hypothetical protein
MKKLIYIIGLVFTIGNASAQISFNNKNVSVSGWGNDNNPKTTSCIITNNSTSAADSIINWSIISFDIPTGWQFDFCDPYDCVSNLGLGFTNSFKLKIGASGPLKGDFFSKSIPGNATVKIRLAYSNGSHDADTLILMAKGWATGLTTIKKQSEVTFFPNPAKDLVTLKYATTKSIDVVIYNVLGAKVKSFTHSSNETTLNISDLEKGLYFIRFSDNGIVTSKSFTKAE